MSTKQRLHQTACAHPLLISTLSLLKPHLPPPLCVFLPATALSQQGMSSLWSFILAVSLEEGMATHPTILAWRIPWTEKAGRLQSMGSQRVEHD